MSSSDDEVSKWHPGDVREIAELLSPLVSPNNVHIFSPEAPLPGIDQYMHISGKTDSAYSSFSGSSNLPDVPMPLGSGEQDLLPLKQVPHMDSGYIGNICKPSARHFEDGQMYENKIVRKGNYPRLDSPAYIKSYGSKPTLEMLYQTASPLTGLSPLLSHPPSPTAQVDHYKTNRNVDETHAGICFSSNAQGETYTEEGNQGLPLHTLPNCCNDRWLSFSQNESPVTEKDVVWCPTNLNTTKNGTTSSTKHSILQEKPKSGSLAQENQEILTAQNAIHAYKIPEATRAKPSLSLQTSHKPVNDPLENKQYYASSVHKPHFGEADLTSRAIVPKKQEGQLYGLLDLLRVDDYSGFDHSIYKSSKSLKYADSSVPNEVTPGIINTYEDKDCTFCSEEGSNRNIRQQQPLEIQNLPSQALAPTETSYGKIYETSRSGSYFNYDAEEVASQLFRGPGKAEQNTTSDTSLLVYPRLEEMLKPFGFPRLPFSKAESQPQNDSANIKINRKTTPLLYYLSGGRNSSLMNHKNQDQEHEQFFMKSPRNNPSGLGDPGIRPKNSNSHVDDVANKSEGSLEEKNDYREKLKFAQQKVLRETSFKRKDLQMSLPVRLKEKPSSRPSIQHLRSLSLSSTNEDSRSIPPSKPQENTYPDWESKKPQTVRIGARKRATKEQKKMSYSEPDKLNQLDDQKDQNISWGQKKARSRSDEITGQGMRIIRSKALENQGRAISKAELKQLQQNALLEYMERKIGQQPAMAKNWSQQTSQLRIMSSKRLPEDNGSNPGTIRKSQNIFFPFPASSGRIHEPPSTFPTLTCTTPTTDRCIVRSLECEQLNSKAQSAISEESYNSKYIPAQSFLHSGSVSSRVRERSQSVPSPVQDYYRPIAFSTSSSQDHEYYAAHHSFSVSEKEDSVDSEDDKKSLENLHSQEAELSLFSKENSKNSQLKQEISENSEVFSDPGGAQWQQREEEDASDQSEKRTDNCTALLDNEGPQCLSQHSANLKVLQNEHEHPSSLQDTALSTAQSKSQQDQKYGHLAVEVIAEDRSLVDILMPHPSRKTVYDLMEGLFPVNTSVIRRTHRRNGEIQSAKANDQRSNEGGTDPHHGTANEPGYRAEDDMFLIYQILNENNENKESLPDVDRITSKKKQLILSIQSKLQTLQDERELIQSEALEHAARGKVLESLVQDLCKPNEFERYLMFMGDLEKVVSLLLCLSTRLARIHNAMGKMDESTDAEEKESLNERYRLLSRQREDAKDLKENLDRRERVVSGILSKYMTENQLQDYRHFIQEKITLLIEQKDLEEHVKFLEEQMERLEKSILP